MFRSRRERVSDMTELLFLFLLPMLMGILVRFSFRMYSKVWLISACAALITVGSLIPSLLLNQQPMWYYAVPIGSFAAGSVATGILTRYREAT